MLAPVSEFDRAAAVHRQDPGRYRASADPEWGGFGRPQGGYVAAQLLDAMIQEVGDADRSPRTATVHMLRGPQFGSYDIEVALERTGRTMSNLTARLTQDGKLIAVALGLFGHDRPGPRFDERPMPQVDPPSPQRRTNMELPGFTAPFADRIVAEHRLGPRPFASPEGPMRLAGWLGFADARPVDGPGLFVLCDALLMPLWVRLDRPVPTATIDYTLHFRAPLPRADPSEMVLAEMSTGLLRDGYFDWDGTVWGQDGTLLCTMRQGLTIVA